ncbi:MAG: LemA family protein [Elusimicrobiota bacterium]|jgi:LemA protein|nr:LemA family protein [Elusimicrobiota bacterium]
MKKWHIILISIIALVIVFISLYISGLNSIVRKYEAVNASWAEIDNQLKRRNDLIPNLVNTVKGYAAHEQEILDNLANARAKLGNATSKEDKIVANNEFEGALSRLLVIVENYPNLKANENFQGLMDELSGTENRIAVARMRYNEQVRVYNTYIKEVIGSFFASRKGLNTPFPYFEVSETDKAVQNVQF